MKAIRRCPACRSFVHPEDRFCWSCGMEMTAPAAAPPAEAPPAKPRMEMEPDASLPLRQAYLAQQRGRLDEAERLVRGVLDIAPDSVPALSMLTAVLRAKGDLLGSVAAAQRVSEVAAETGASSGAVERAREDRARIEEQVVRELGGPLNLYQTPLTVFHPSGGEVWYKSAAMYAGLAGIGVVSLFLALVAVLRGHLSGYLWFGLSLVAAGWCYNDAESRRQTGLLWAPFVLTLGPFGLAVYLLAVH
jgi:hypothetical protein